MKLSRFFQFTIAVLGLALSPYVVAQDIQVLPEPDDQCLPYEYDYGDVEVGDSGTMLFTITNTDGSDLIVSQIAITDNTSGSFAITAQTPANSLPGAIASGESVDVEITFAPTSVGSKTATWVMRTDATNTTPCGEVLSYFEYYLQGTGVAVEPPPGEQMAALIGFFEDGVATGDIFGAGPGNSAGGRLKAFGNMLDAADDLIADGDIASACEQLGDAANRADGTEPPPDFIGGADATAVYTMILEVMSALGCEVSVM